MREMKTSQFANIPFPKMDDIQKNELIKIYDSETDVDDKQKIKLEKFEEFDSTNIDNFGIIQITSQLQFLKTLQRYMINKIFNDEDLDLELNEFTFYMQLK